MSDDRPEVVSLSFESSDVAEVEHYFARTYTDLTIEVPGERDEFACRHDAVIGGGVGMSRLTMPLSWTADVDEIPDQIVVDHVRAGGLTLSSSDHGEVTTGAGQTVLVPPSGGFGVHCDHLDVDVIGLDMQLVAEYTEQVRGVAPDELEFTSIMPISAAFAAYWVGSVERVRHDVFGDPVNAASPIILAEAFRSLAAGLLTAFPNTALDRAADAPAPRGAVSDATLREVVGYLEAFAREPIGPADITEMAGMPAREIVAGLHRRRDVHPAQVLWQARLRGVRTQLRDADPTVATVREIAAQWGFADPARFRIAYAQAFQESPERTLRR